MAYACLTIWTAFHTPTQGPIQPGERFIYEFTPKDAGTYWFHPHVRSNEQVERGLYGVLIVEDEHALPYSRDVVWVIEDWLLDEKRQIFARFNTLHDLSHDGRWGNVTTANGHTDTSLKVNAGERIRLRMLNFSNGRVYVPDFAKLEPKTSRWTASTCGSPLPSAASSWHLATLGPGSHGSWQREPSHFRRRQVSAAAPEAPGKASTFKVVPLDEGSWMLYCHILEHAEAGMMTMLDVRG